LRYLMRHLEGAHLLLIGTYRNTELQRDHALRTVLAESRRRSDSARIELLGLTDGQVQLLSQHIVDHSVSEASGATLQRLTEGNPLFVEEIIRYMVDQGLSLRLQQATPDSVLAPRLPLGVREMIGTRLVRLSPSCHQVLAVGSILGREFELDTLRQVADLPDDELLNALEDAQRARVVDDVSQDRDVRFRFAHALFRETLYLDLFTPRRLMLHQRVAQVLDRAMPRTSRNTRLN
jgi:predicted ATPase